MNDDDRIVDVARRENLTALLRVLGGAVGVATLSGCAEPSAAPAESRASTSEPLSGGSFLWADTVADLRGIVGSDGSATSQPVVFLGGFAAPAMEGAGSSTGTRARRPGTTVERSSCPRAPRRGAGSASTAAR